ncbi:helix-turn-helix domain-containing protein [Granulosicoccus sp.]|nr:helix-turn-helix domain-containing protein [Granulosicoccus sp.]
MSALSHETRLKIVRHLVKAGAEGETAGSIGAAVNAAPSKITFHISSLERAGLVSSERRSRQIIYRIRFEMIGSLLKYIMQDCCKYNSSVLEYCGVKNIDSCC